MSDTLGLIGVGQLAGYFIAGLRHSGDRRALVLGPRNATIADRLAARFDGVVADSNQAVVDRADILVLATRPEHALEALESVRLKAGQLVISVVAGLDLTTLVAHAGEAIVVRSLPVFSAEIGAGAIPLYPDNERARSVLEKLGEVVGLPDESSFNTAAVLGCTFTWFLRLYAELQAWLERQGIESHAARTLALQCAHGASAYGLARPGEDLADIASAIGRPGTYSLAGEEVYREAGGFEALTAACDAIGQMFDRANAPTPSGKADPND